MRLSLPLLPGLLVTSLLAGCQQPSPSVTQVQSDPSSSALPVLVNELLAQQQAGRYTIAIDPATLSGTVALVSDHAAQANDDVYDLSISNFLRRDSLKILGISRSATTLDITYQVTHPFAAPTNLAGPATAANRADLGVAGRVCFLMDVPSASGNTYFQTAAAGAAGVTNVVANTSTVVNADGY